MLFVREVDYVTWVKAIDKRSGVNVQDYVALPFNGTIMNKDNMATEEVAFVLMMDPNGALAIVEGIAKLLEGPHPPKMNMPGTN